MKCNECRHKETRGANEYCTYHDAYIGWHGCEYGEPKPQTNADRIRAMTEEGLANQLVSEQYVAMKMVLTLLCQKLKDEKILDEKDAKEGFCDFENEVKKRWGDMVKEKLEWLKAPVEVDE